MKGAYVSADDIPEQAEIHLFDSPGGDFTVQQRRSALRGSSETLPDVDLSTSIHRSPPPPPCL